MNLDDYPPGMSQSDFEHVGEETKDSNDLFFDSVYKLAEFPTYVNVENLIKEYNKIKNPSYLCSLLFLEENEGKLFSNEIDPYAISMILNFTAKEIIKNHLSKEDFEELKTVYLQRAKGCKITELVKNELAFSNDDKLLEYLQYSLTKQYNVLNENDLSDLLENGPELNNVELYDTLFNSLSEPSGDRLSKGVEKYIGLNIFQQLEYFDYITKYKDFDFYSFEEFNKDVDTYKSRFLNSEVKSEQADNLNNNQSIKKTIMENENKDSQEQKTENKALYNNQYARGWVYNMEKDEAKKQARFSVKVQNKDNKFGDVFINVFASGKNYDKLEGIDNKDFIEVDGKAQFNIYEDKNGLKNKSNNIMMFSVVKHELNAENNLDLKADFKHYFPNRLEIKTHLSKNAELVKTSKGELINLSAANNESWKDEKGEEQKRTNWIDAVMFPSKNIDLEDYKDASKGQPMHMVGIVQPNSYEDTKGNKRYNVKVSVMEATLSLKKEKSIDNSKKKEEKPSKQMTR